MTYSATMTEVQYTDPLANSHKFYRAYVLHDTDTDDARVLYNWGRIGATGQFQVSVQPGVEAAQRTADGKISDKVRKGYRDTANRVLRIVPVDLLEHAGISDNVRSQAAAALTKDPFARLGADTDRLIRMVTGPADVQMEAITLKRDLDEQLAALKVSLMQAEGSLELAGDVLSMKLGA